MSELTGKRKKAFKPAYNLRPLKRIKMGSSHKSNFALSSAALSLRHQESDSSVLTYADPTAKEDMAIPCSLFTLEPSPTILSRSATPVENSPPIASSSSIPIDISSHAVENTPVRCSGSSISFLSSKQFSPSSYAPPADMENPWESETAFSKLKF
jgi:hypothetical protein